jgi:hypothetical protein
MLPWILWGAGTLAVAAVLVAVDRRWDPSRQHAPTDPGVRVAGAVRSISGSESVRRVQYDRTTRVAEVDVTSRYYDAAKPVAENREYLATEGRLGAQLALFDNAGVAQVVLRLYAGQTLLATVNGRQGQKYEEIQVEYHGPLLRQ